MDNSKSINSVAKTTGCNEKTPHFHGEFSSLTITIFPSFIKKTNEIIQRILNINVVCLYKLFFLIEE
jgi:hypothetical protein